MTEQALRKETTSHPYIVINKDVCGGSPIIEGTRTRVIDIAIEYELLGRSADEIIRSHPHVSLYQIHDALSYYYENRDELDKKIKKDRGFITLLKVGFPSKMVCANNGHDYMHILKKIERNTFFHHFFIPWFDCAQIVPVKVK